MYEASCVWVWYSADLVWYGMADACGVGMVWYGMVVPSMGG